MAVVARALNDTFVNAAPPSLLRGGVYVPFTTPHLMIARLRHDEDGRPNALVPALSGGQGYYVVPWPMLPDLISMTVYDRAMHEAFAGLPQADPILVRSKALEVRQCGLCGPHAAIAAKQDSESDARRRESIFCHLVQLIAVQVGRPIEGLTRDNLRESENMAALRGLATHIDLPPDSLIERLDAWSSQIGLLGMNRKPLRGPIREQVSELRAMLSVMGEWASNDHPEYVGSAMRCLSAGNAILDLIQSQINRIDNECSDALGVVKSWHDSAGRLKSIAGFAATAVQIWHAATGEWRKAAALRDRHEMRAKIGFIETLLPVLAPSDMLKFQRNRVASALSKRPAKSKSIGVTGVRRANSDPGAGLREAIDSAADPTESLQHMLCWPLRSLIRQPNETELPGDISMLATAGLVHNLRKTWSTRDVARFDAVIAAVDDPELFEREVHELRKTVHLMLVEWIHWNSDHQPDDDTGLDKPADVPTLDDAEIYAATTMLSAPLVNELMGALPAGPITWLTIDNMRHIGTCLESMTKAGFPQAAVAGLHVIMRAMAEPCDIIPTLRHLSAHHAQTVTDQDHMRSIVDALLERLRALSGDVAKAIETFDGTTVLAAAINRYADAVSSGIMNLPLRQDGGVTIRVAQINRALAETIRTDLLDRHGQMIDDAFPSCADPFAKDGQGVVANLNASPDQLSLSRVEAVMDLIPLLADHNKLFGLKSALDQCMARAAEIADRAAVRLLEAVSRTGAAQSQFLAQHVMYTVWVVERTKGSDQADRLRKTAHQAVEPSNR